jgi:hypothetical protein
LTAGGPTRKVELRGITDGRAIEILASWPDKSQTELRRGWGWDKAAEQYRLDVRPVDSFALLWPLEGKRAPAVRNMFAAQPAIYDCWDWIAAWTNISVASVMSTRFDRAPFTFLNTRGASIPASLSCIAASSMDLSSPDMAV